MNPCHCHLAVPPFIVEASGVCLTRKLVEIVSHAAELADVSGMFLRQPFFHMTVTANDGLETAITNYNHLE